MSFPPPPGLKQAPPSSLPPRPPPSASTQSSSFKPAYSAAPSYAPSGASSGYGGNTSRTGYNAFTAFQPRSVASSQPYRTSSPVVSAPPAPAAGYSAPATGYGAGYQQTQQSYQGGATYYGQAQYNDNTYGPSMPRSQNAFTPAGSDQVNAYGTRGRNYGGNDSGLDPDTEAQIAQWQSAYAPKDEAAVMSKGPGRRDGLQPATGPNTGANTPSVGFPAANTPTPVPGQPESTATVVRSGGGQTWTDSTLLEWDPAHFRLFVGNLAGEVTDDSLLKAFSKYTSVQKARVIRDKRTQKSKGYGFVSFSDGDDYFKAAREMQGKYIGSHPVLLRRATTEVRPATGGKPGKKQGGGGGAGSSTGGGNVKGDGVKKHGKTKGGLKILG